MLSQTGGVEAVCLATKRASNGCREAENGGRESVPALCAHTDLTASPGIN